MTEPVIVWIDLETGGLDPRKHAVLEVAACTAAGTTWSRLVRWPQLDSGKCVDPEALKVNGLDVQEILVKGVSCLQAVTELATLVGEANLAAGLPSDARIVFGGHNFGGFDYHFLKRLHEVAGRPMPPHLHSFADTAANLRLLGSAEVLPTGVQVGDEWQSIARLDAAIHHFGLRLPDGMVRHRALGDAWLTRKVYEACLDAVRALAPTRNMMDNYEVTRQRWLGTIPKPAAIPFPVPMPQSKDDAP